MYYHNTAVNMRAGARISTPRDSRCHNLPLDVCEALVQFFNNLQVVVGGG